MQPIERRSAGRGGFRGPTERILDKAVRHVRANDRKTYFGIVFEYVTDEQNDQHLVEQVDLFLYRAGFSHTLSTAERNWRASKVVDHGEYIHPEGFGWSSGRYKSRLVKEILI